jgi:hypothetical protein
MNRAERRRLAREAKTATRTTAALSEADFAARRIVLTALGLQVTEDGKTVLCAADAEHELRLHIDRIEAAGLTVGATDDMETMIAAFTREWTPESARKCAAALIAYARGVLAYADTFDAAKAAVDRLNSEASARTGSASVAPPGPETAAP